MMMKSKRRSPMWPYLGILACLFVLSITAPRAWDRMSRRDSSLRDSLAPRALDANRSSRRQAAGADSAELATSRALDAETPLDVELELRADASESSNLATESVSQALDAIVPDLAGGLDPTMITTDQDAPSTTTAARDDAPSVDSPEHDVPAAPELSEHARQSREEVELADRRSAPAVPPVVADGIAGLPAEPDYAAVTVSSHWPLPRALEEQLTSLTSDKPTAEWSTKTIGLIEDLCRLDSDNRTQKVAILKQLRGLSGHHMTSAGHTELETRLARAQYSLLRWLDIWEAAVDLEQLPVVKTSRKSSAEKIKAAVAAVTALSRRGASSLQWREYFQLDDLRRLAKNGGTPAERRAVARRVLDRLASPRLSQAQRKFVSTGPVAELQTQLRAWAAEPVSAARVLAHLEQFERTGLPSDARLVADDYRGLSWSSPPEAEKMSQFLEVHYRNANIRLAATGALLNRLVPQPQTTVAEVNDTVVNVPVYGSSTTLTKLYVRLVPDATRIRVGIEANGAVASDTVSTSGPATFHNQGRSTFLVRKLFVIGPHGLSVWPAVSEADNDYNYLVSVETGFDGVPLFGSVVRGIARSKHDEAQGEARMEVEQKVACRARTQLDEEIRPHLARAAENIEKKQLAALDRLGLELVPVEFSTTEDRVVARMRLGNPQQLGANTPRPRAPSDNWLSLQLHQSAINNGAERLGLDGRSFDLPQLFAWLAKKLNRPQLAKLDDLPEDVHLTFAAKDAVRVRCEGDRVQVILTFAELTQKGHHWRDFTACASYRPQTHGLDPKLVRDDTPVYLEGKSVKGVQVALRAIFSKVLSRSRDISLLDEKLTRDPRLADLVVSQFVVEDGWIGLAYGPPRPNKMTRRPK